MSAAAATHVYPLVIFLHLTSDFEDSTTPQSMWLRSRPFPADLTLVDAAVAYLWPKQPPEAEAAKLPKQLQLQ